MTRALGNQPINGMPAAERTLSDAELKLVGNRREIEKRVALAFHKHDSRSMEFSVLQALARSIEREAVQRIHLGTLEELLVREGSGAARDAVIFTAAVVIYKRQGLRFLPDLLELASYCHPVRGAVMWRILRTIRRLAPQASMTDGAAQRRQRWTGQLCSQL